MNFETPREAMLIAENKRLKAENEYLKQATEHYYKKLTYVAAIDEKEIYAPELPPSYQLPACADIRGSLTHTGNYHVVAKLKYARPEDLQISYYAPATTIKSKAEWAINELMPYLHERFIWSLATAIQNDK